METEVVKEEKRNYFRVFATAQETNGLEKEQGKVEDNGIIPKWLSGIYLKVGPGKFDFYDSESNLKNGGDKKNSSKSNNSNSNSSKNRDSDKENNLSEKVFTVNNFLDGYAICTKFEISQGRVSLQKKFIQSDAYKKAVGAARPVLPESHTCCSPDPSKSFFRRLVPSVVPDMSDNTSHALFNVAGSIFTSNESYHLWRIDPETLGTLKKYDTSKLLGVNQISAHPVLDAQNNCTFSVGTTMSATGCKYCIVKTPCSQKPTSANTKNALNKCILSPPDDDSEALALFKQSKSMCAISPWSMTLTAFMHSISITRNYVVLIEQPFFTNLSKVAKSITFGKNYCYSDWVEAGPVSNRIYIIDKESGATLGSSIEIYTKTPFYFSHFINAFEDKVNTVNDNEGEEVLVFDLNAYGNPDIFECSPLNINSLRNNGLCTLKEAAAGLRFIIPLDLLKNEKRWKDSVGDTDQSSSLVSDKARGKYRIGSTKAIKIEEIEKKSCANAERKDNKLILTPQVFTEKGVEWPIINQQKVGQKYKFLYGSSGFFKSEAYSNSVLKINMETGETLKYIDENCIFGEPCFVPEPESKLNQNSNSNVKSKVNGDSKKESDDEDAGVLLVVTHDVRASKEAKDSLLILNARDLKVMARVAFDSHIPPSNHGLFLAK